MNKIKKHTKYWEWVQKCRSGTEKCAKCGEMRFLTVDHIVPLMILNQFALDDIQYDYEENFEILCKWCNQQKAHMLDPRNPKVYTVLRNILDRAEKEIFLTITK